MSDKGGSGDTFWLALALIVIFFWGFGEDDVCLGEALIKWLTK